MAKWQQKYRVDWGAIDGRTWRAQRTVWEILMEKERFKRRAQEEDQGVVALVLDWRRPSSGSVFLWCGPGLRTSVSQQRSRECCAVFHEHPRRVLFEGCVAEPLRTITAILPGSKWSRLLLRVVLQDPLGEVTQIYLS